MYRIPLPLPNDGLRAVNAYAIVDDEGVDVVDPGWTLPQSRDCLESGLKTLDCSLGDIRQFLITHVHRDHYTQAVAIRRDFGTRVSLGIREQDSLRNLQSTDRHPFDTMLIQLRTCGAAALASWLQKERVTRPPFDPSDWESPDEWLESSTMRLTSGRILQVIETPGHTKGHVVLLDLAERLLFAGDHVLPTITPSIGFEQAPSANPLADFLGSLAKVRNLPDATLLPAHGPVTESVHARIDELVAHHRARLDHTEEAVRKGANTPYAAAAILRWTRREQHFRDLDPFNQMLAVFETRAHLRLLASQGYIARVDEHDELEHYESIEFVKN